MGRRKLEMKRIEDKSSRSVTFSKRRAGLFKKARQLSVLCDVDVAVIVFSAGGKLYEFSDGRGNSVERIISRYEKRCLKTGEINTSEAGEDLVTSPLKSHLCKRFQTCIKLLQTVDRLAEKDNAGELSVNCMTQLELGLGAALMQTRLKKTQLMMEYISTLKEKDDKLSEEKQELEKQVALASNGFDDDGGNNLASNHINVAQLAILPLFKG